MAVGTVSAANTDNWQLIATNTPSGAASSTFSSISGYNTLMVVVKGLTPSAGGVLGLRFNGDGGDNYASNSWITTSQYDHSSQGIAFHYYSTAQTTSGYVKIFDAANTTVPKTTETVARWTLPTRGIWTDTSPITSISVQNLSSGTISGTIYLYGLAV